VPVQPVASESSSLAVAAALSQTPRLQHHVRAALRNIVVSDQQVLDAVVRAFNVESTDDSLQFCLLTVNDVRAAIQAQRQEMPVNWTSSGFANSASSSSSSASSSSSSSTSAELQQFHTAEQSLSLITSRFGFAFATIVEPNSVPVALLSGLKRALGSEAPADEKTLRSLLSAELLQPQSEAFYFGMMFEDISKKEYREMVQILCRNQASCSLHCLLCCSSLPPITGVA